MNLSKNKIIEQEALALSQWFIKNARPLPWRETSDPYKIWISEIMLQQTTVKAVIPFYNKFIKKFPNVKKLAFASIEDIYLHWAGLGYYSRARNLHKAAKEIVGLKKFPDTFEELLKLSGFGDYTARAVSSQAFAEKVGVVDGNVIRVLSRHKGLKIQHWKTKEKKKLQNIADMYAQTAKPREINQAFMELGATICTPQSPTCFLCPLQKNCEAYKKDLIKKLPLKKPKKEFEIWQWNVDLIEDKGRVAFINNQYAPFLKKQLILPGQVEFKKVKPKKYDLLHSITHHKIFVKITRRKSNSLNLKKNDFIWIERKRLKEKVPFTLIQKTIDIGLGDSF